MSRRGIYGTMEEYPKLYLECQVHRLIQLKYNFIHYNPLPPIKRSDQEVKETEELKMMNYLKMKL